MSADISSELSRYRFCAMIVAIILLFQFNETKSESESSLMFPPKEMMGSSYVPPDDSKWINELPEDERGRFTAKPYYLPGDLSDWSQLSFLQDHKLKQVRFFFIGDKEHHVDVTLKDQAVCRKLALALNNQYMFRSAVSDIGRGGGSYGGGACLGVMQLQFEGVEEPVIIGIAKIGFFLDRFYGSTRQTFHSKYLAVVLADILEKHTKYQMNSEYIEAQSGKRYFELPANLLKDMKPSQ
ncbi:hypothetical protein [Gimesia sp.]|uniref:hypothetical protein n=1 Tax=Gimesia sp. TaxID=2024833 RepID=UPI000C5CFE8C|nr:hypothetical protein [Gimesia sp.]MAX38552.1 hypothetical protein [Gimesia sp.]HAH44674.1 hypothetical protein [Planctomycetaceae bacterium]HBL44456.1 hypothetical protein [Planctomycetaceae bacterium]